MLILSIGEALATGVVGLLLLIDSVVYGFLSTLFSLFESLAGAEILNQSVYHEISQRVYVVIGIVALFFIVYSLLRALVNPDELNKTTSKIATNTIISLVLIGLIPTFFEKAFEIQNAIIDDNIIANIIFGEGTNNTISNTGRLMSLTSLSAFVNINNDTVASGNLNWAQTKTAILNGGSFSLISQFAEVINEGIDNASYTPIISTLCGAFLCYIVLSFCLDLGLRVVKLAFYEIIAPIPILLRILPEKKSVFDNWVKKTLATFFEVFVRIAIIYLIVFLVSKIVGDDINIINNSELNLIAKVIVFMGIFAFAKQAPKLISEITGIDSGNIKFGIRGKLKDSFSTMESIPILGGLGSRAVGAVTGGIGAATTSLFNGAGLSGFGYGALNGWNGKGVQFHKQRSKLYNDVYGLKGKQGIFGGQPITTKIENNLKKEAKDNYVGALQAENEAFENSNQFKLKEQEFINEQYNDKNKEINLAEDSLEKYKEIYNNIKHKVDAKNASRLNYENGSEYKGIMARYQNQVLNEADAIMKAKMKDYAVTPEGRNQYQKDKQDLIEQLQRKYTFEELQRLDKMGTSSNEAKEYLKNISSYSSDMKELTESQNNVNKANEHLNDLVKAYDDIDSNLAKQQAREYFTGDNAKEAGSLKYKANVKYIKDVEEEKAMKKRMESLDGKEEIAKLAEALKMANKEQSNPSSSEKKDK